VDAGGQLWDAIVVGAGPAGCAAAYDLARRRSIRTAGRQEGLPPAKACAGGLTIKAVQALRYSIEPVVRRWCAASGWRVRARLLSADAGCAEEPRPICVMTVRAELDEYCLRKTIAAGACFRKDSRVQQIVRSASRCIYHRRRKLSRALSGRRRRSQRPGTAPVRGWLLVFSGLCARGANRGAEGGS
jgi:flavin-dependent dehydrogenase